MRHDRCDGLSRAVALAPFDHTSVVDAAGWRVSQQPPYRVPGSPGPSTVAVIHPAMVTTSESLPGHRIVRALGLVHGVALQHVNYPGSLAASDVIDAHQRARREALAYMLRFAAEMGANAVIGVRYAMTKISESQTEFLAYGTAAWAES